METFFSFHFSTKFLSTLRWMGKRWPQPHLRNKCRGKALAWGLLDVAQLNSWIRVFPALCHTLRRTFWDSIFFYFASEPPTTQSDPVFSFMAHWLTRLKFGCRRAYSSFQNRFYSFFSLSRMAGGHPIILLGLIDDFVILIWQRASLDIITHTIAQQ